MAARGPSKPRLPARPPKNQVGCRLRMVNEVKGEAAYMASLLFGILGEDRLQEVVSPSPSVAFAIYGCFDRGVRNESPNCITYGIKSVSRCAKPSPRAAEISKGNTAANASAGGATSLRHSCSSAIGVRGIASARSLRVSGNSDWRPNEESETDVSFVENTFSSL